MVGPARSTPTAQFPSARNDMKLNLGCGPDYRQGWVNVDCNTQQRADLYLVLGRDDIPINDDSVDEVYMCHSLEHIQHFLPFLEELYRVCRNGAKLHIIVPHYSGPQAFAPQHYSYWSCSAWWTMAGKSHENYTPFRCKIDSVRLNFVSHYVGASKRVAWLFRPYEWIANALCELGLHMLVERFPFGWSEVEYRLEVAK